MTRLLSCLISLTCLSLFLSPPLPAPPPVHRAFFQLLKLPKLLSLTGPLHIRFPPLRAPLLPPSHLIESYVTGPSYRPTPEELICSRATLCISPTVIAVADNPLFQGRSPTKMSTPRGRECVIFTKGGGWVCNKHRFNEYTELCQPLPSGQCQLRPPNLRRDTKPPRGEKAYVVGRSMWLLLPGPASVSPSM